MNLFCIFIFWIVCVILLLLFIMRGMSKNNKIYDNVTEFEFQKKHHEDEDIIDHYRNDSNSMLF